MLFSLYLYTANRNLQDGITTKLNSTSILSSKSPSLTNPNLQQSNLPQKLGALDSTSGSKFSTLSQSKATSLNLTQHKRARATEKPTEAKRSNLLSLSNEKVKYAGNSLNLTNSRLQGSIGTKPTVSRTLSNILVTKSQTDIKTIRRQVTYDDQKPTTRPRLLP